MKASYKVLGVDSALSYLLVVVSIFVYSSIFPQADGAKIFKSSCAVCHKLNNQRLVGPGLQDVTKKRDPEWLKKWIINSSDLIKSGDATAKALYDEFQSPMPPFALNDDEMKALITFLDTPPVEVPAVATAPAAQATAPPSPIWVWNGATITLVICLAFIIGLCIYILMYAQKALEQIGRPLFSFEPSTVEADYSLKWFADNKITVAVLMITIVLIAILFAL